VVFIPNLLNISTLSAMAIISRFCISVGRGDIAKYNRDVAIYHPSEVVHKYLIPRYTRSSGA
jgi:hypothetical protein